jgi:hypothetical protein
MDFFASPKALLERARHHTAEFAAAETQYLAEEGAFTLDTDLDLLTGDDLRKVRFNSDVPLEIACIAFDAINALRSALDHAVFSATSIVTGGAEPEQTKFPFGLTRANAEKQFQEGARDVPTKLRPLILSFRPYKDGDAVLWGLNRIRNTKIHRALTPFATAGIGFRLRGTGTVGRYEDMNEWNPITRELTYARTRDVSPTISVKPNFGFAFGSATDLPVLRVNGVLNHVAEVTARVISALEVETNRCGTEGKKPLIPMRWRLDGRRQSEGGINLL